MCYEKLDPVLQLLRQLTYDYRMSNPRLRDHIKTLMGASAPLQVRECLFRLLSQFTSIPLVL